MRTGLRCVLLVLACIFLAAAASGTHDTGSGTGVQADSGIDLEIVDTSHPSRVSAGEEIDFRVTVENRGSRNAEDVTIGVRAYGQLKELDFQRIDSNRQRTFTVPFTVPTDASGPETVQLEATAVDRYGDLLERDVATMDIDVSEAHLSMRLNPSHVTANELVEVRGMMNAPGMDADLYVDGSYIDTVTSDETRQYSHTIEVTDPGFHRVELRAGNARETAYLRVDPDLGILDMNVPETANTQDRFDACATVTTATSEELTLTVFVDGEAQDARTFPAHGEQEECFQLGITDAGEHDITFEVESDGVTDTMTQRMQVIESRIEVNVFPQQITLARGSSGMFQVEIQNRDAHARTYEIDVSGIEEISETTHERVSLGRDESRTTFIRVSPPESGVYSGNVTVTADGVTFADTDVTVRAHEDPGLRGPLDGVWRALTGVWDYLRTHAAAIGLGLAAIIAIGVIGFALYRRQQERDVIEPRY